MAVKNNEVQPGAILNEVIVGAFRANGSSFGDWCRANGVHPSTAQGAIFGHSGGDRGRALLRKIIEAAGADVVTMAYRKRIERHAAEVAA